MGIKNTLYFRLVTFTAVFLFFAGLALNSVVRVLAENQGSVKTVANCEDVNINPFNEGDIIRGKGDNFLGDEDYRWTIVKVDQPGKGTEVANGNFHLDAEIDAFCFVIWNPATTIAGDSHSEFKWSVERKDQKCTGPSTDERCEDEWVGVDSDNFFVNGEGKDTPNESPTPVPSGVPTPTPTPTPEVNSTPAPPGPKVCDASKPSTPLLLSVTRTSLTTALLKWSPVTPATYYVIAYGTDPNNLEFGVPNAGNTDNFTVGALNPNLNYYFNLRAVNDCMPSDPSAVLGIGVTLGVSTGKVLGASTERLAATGSELFLPRLVASFVVFGLTISSGLKLLHGRKKN